MLRLTRSIGVDIRLLPFDVAATKAHARALVAAGILDGGDAESIARVCDEIEKEWREGSLIAAPEDEDVHLLVERLLTERLGEPGRRIHAGRSRNDLVVTDLRLWGKDRAEHLTGLVADVLGVIADLGEEHAGTVMPGYTHLQRAHPVTLGFHLLAHGFALARDGGRFIAAGEAADVSPLGAGALGGSTLPIDPQIAAAELGFAAVFDNAMDAVSDRDFACDLVYAAAMCGVHLSRFAEDVVLWTSSEFGFARLSDEFSTGSSMMPHKRNPDLAELIRGRAAPGIGDLASLLALLKGLPLAYDRDLQEDKDLVFSATDRIASGLEAAGHLLRSLRFDTERMATAAGASGAWATDLAEALVARGVPLRDAHHATGRLVADLETHGIGLADATEDLLRSHHDLLEAGDVAVADPRRSIDLRNDAGGTAPERVREQAATLMDFTLQLQADRL